MWTRLAVIGTVVGLCVSIQSVAGQEVPGWERIENHGMEGHNIGGPEVLSVEDCAAKCDATSGCLGFDYYRNSRQCLANDADGRTAPGALKLNNPVDFYQREMVDTHGRPAPSYNPGQPDWRVSDAYCHDYAKTAVDQHRYNLDHRCGYTGNRWTSVYDGHFAWCKSASPSRSKFETKHRYDKLVTCQQSGGSGGGSSSGSSGSSSSGSGGGSISTGGLCVNGYVGISSAGISARNRRVLSNHSEASCRAACNGESWCISFELSTKGACHLSDVNRQTPGIKFNQPANFPWTYYEKCGVAGGGTSAGLGDPYNQPWTTAQGRTCFERWVRDTESRLNTNRGSDRYNRDKPYRINQYGHITFQSTTTFFAPDDFQSAGGTRFQWLWKHSREQGQYWYFRNSARDPRDRVQAYELKYYVRQCMAGNL